MSCPACGTASSWPSAAALLRWWSEGRLCAGHVLDAVEAHADARLVAAEDAQ